MSGLLSEWFAPSAFTPHGFCLLWEPGLIWLQTVSDGLIGLAYFSIPLALLSFRKRRPDIEYGWIIVLFAVFILACGTSHLMSIVTLWVPLYWLEGGIKMLTALTSVMTATLLWPLIPRLAAIPSPRELRDVNAALQAQIIQRDRDAAVLRERERQLRRAQKMEGLGKLAGGIAHDFNNVLQVVLSGLTLIQNRATEPDMVRKLAQSAANAAERGSAVTGRLLAFTRTDVLQIAPQETSALLDGMAEMLSHSVGDQFHIETAIALRTPPILADKAQLETVLVNLAINARDAMPDGGTIMLRAAPETVVLEGEHPAGLAPGRYVRLSVEDTGEGMTAETLARAGEPFFTTKPHGIGTGLGLAMARGFAEHSGGGMALESVQGKGTRVTLWMPQADVTLPPPAPRPAEPPSQPARLPVITRPVRILLVDDNHMVLQMLVGHLVESGFDVSSATDGPAALVQLDAGQPIDVLVTDFSMPGMDGLTLIDEVYRRHPTVPALLLTGYADDSVRARVAARMQDHPERQLVLARKPISAEDLVARTMALLELQQNK